jgi:preprotein translocase subunit SecE
VRRNWSRREQIQAVVLLVVVNLAFIYFIYFLSDPITEWLLDILGLAD